MAAEGQRRQTAQSRGRRSMEVRQTVYEDHYIAADDTGDLRQGAVVASDLYAAVDIPGTEGAADWDTAVLVESRDRLTVMLRHTAGTTTTAVHIAVQVSYTDNNEDADWYDLFEDEADDGVLVRKVFDWTTAVDGNIAWDIRTHGRYMRFKIWVDGAAPAGSRAVLYVRRLQDAS